MHALLLTIVIGKCFLRSTLFWLSIALPYQLKLNLPIVAALSDLIFQSFSVLLNATTTSYYATATYSAALPMHVVQNPLQTTNLAKTVNVVYTIRLTIRHTDAFIQIEYVKKKLFHLKLIKNLLIRELEICLVQKPICWIFKT